MKCMEYGFKDGSGKATFSIQINGKVQLFCESNGGAFTEKMENCQRFLDGICHLLCEPTVEHKKAPAIGRGFLFGTR